MNILSIGAWPVVYVTDCWFLGLHNFCAKHCIQIHVKANRVPSSARQHDQFIMDITTSMPFKRQELVDINLVRIYFQVCTISNIATAVGGSLHLSAWKVDPFSDRRINLSFPRQETPTSSQRTSEKANKRSGTKCLLLWRNYYSVLFNSALFTYLYQFGVL